MSDTALAGAAATAATSEAPLPGPETPPAPEPTPEPPKTFERETFSAGGGRKTIFSFLLLILLPFFASLPAMIYMRVSNGLLFDSIGLAIMATAFTILMFLIFVELMFSLRARVDLGDDKASLTLPAGRGPTPMLRYKSHVIPYADVHTVETRREIYGGAIAPMLLKGARVTMKDGTVIPLGYVSEANVDPAFPFPEIAKKIADRARLPLIDRGNVRRSMRRKVFGIKSDGSEGPLIEESEIEKLNRSHNNVMLWMIGGLVLLMIAGIVDDFASGSPIGQTATMVQPSSPMPAKTPPAKPVKK